jgi:hypothetical protein
MKWFRNDSSGRESRTFVIVSFSWLAVWVKFIGAGLTLPVLGTIPPMTATEFGVSIAAIMSIWLGREFIKKDK